MKKQIIIDYEEYLELMNTKQQYCQEIEKIKKNNNYDILLKFIEDYETILKYKDVKVRSYDEDNWREITLPFNRIYEECKERIKNKVIDNSDN